jgi:hypothetical protein
VAEHVGGGNVLPPTAKPKGYSLTDIAKATAFFTTTAPNDNTFTVQPGTMLYVPIFFADDSPEIFGHFPDATVPEAVTNYFFSDDELGAEFLEIVIDGKITSIAEDSGYIVGVKGIKLADGPGTQYLPAAVFLTPLTKGTHSVTIRAEFTGAAIPSRLFKFEIPYTVIVN